MADYAPFATRTVGWLIAVGVVSFAGAAFFTVVGDRARSTGANAFSVSAIGHRALARTLERLDVPVVVSRYRSAAKVRAGGILVIAEPTRRILEDEEFQQLLQAPDILYVLPKRAGDPAPDRPDWLRRTDMVPGPIARSALDAVITGGNVVRREEKVRWTLNRLGPTPEIDRVQLVVGGSLRPIVASGAGILVGEARRGDNRVWVLSDPDVIANHGLGQGDNAAFAVALIDSLRRPGGAVVIDETHHGFSRPPSLWRAAFRLPFVIVTLQAVIAVVVLLWAASGRFGAPVPVPAPFRSGKAALIDNAANLVEAGGSAASHAFARYVATLQRDVARRLHAPRRLDDGALAHWLDRIGRARAVSENYTALNRAADAFIRRKRADDARILRAARRLHRWRQEMIDGSGSDRDGRAAA